MVVHIYLMYFGSLLWAYRSLGVICAPFSSFCRGLVSTLGLKPLFSSKRYQTKQAQLSVQITSNNIFWSNKLKILIQLYGSLKSWYIFF